MMHLYSALSCIAIHPKRFTIMWNVLLIPTQISLLFVINLLYLPRKQFKYKSTMNVSHVVHMAILTWTNYYVFKCIV